jgi:citrate lyase subunit beta / citryl-CoA lyase
MIVYRSLLFAPADRPDIGEKLARSGADAVVIDLEDAIAPSSKDVARAAAHDVARALDGARVDAFVRVNPPGTPWFEHDVDAVVEMRSIGLVLPKADDPEVIRYVDDRLRRGGCERVRVIAGLETASGVAGCVNVLIAPVMACYFGAEDYVADVGGRRTERGDEVLFARSAVVMNARLAGIAAIDQAVIDIADGDRFRRDAASGRDLGFSGKICVHPSQVPLANDVFTHSADEIAASRALVESYEAAMARGAGVVVLDGQMIDEAIVRRARAVLAQAAVRGEV